MKYFKIKKEHLGKVTIPIFGADGSENRIALDENISAEDLKLVSENEVGVTFLEEVKGSAAPAQAKP